ncbi:tautomerase family protein [Curtobacterium flaccumfaciens]|nr:tautomerase family protein [Curtobacterium flaccumfaciens]
MEALEYPPEKRFQRFVGLDPSDFVYPGDRGPNYTIIEISMFEGRSDAAKRKLISELFARIENAAGISPHSVEITITETPKANWASGAGTPRSWRWTITSRSEANCLPPPTVASSATGRRSATGHSQSYSPMVGRMRLIRDSAR